MHDVRRTGPGTSNIAWSSTGRLPLDPWFSIDRKILAVVECFVGMQGNLERPELRAKDLNPERVGPGMIVRHAGVFYSWVNRARIHL